MTSHDLNLYKPGTKVSIPCGDGTIQSISISIRGVQYEVGYWSTSNEWKLVWLPEDEVKTEKTPKSLRIGFIKHGS